MFSAFLAATTTQTGGGLVALAPFLLLIVLGYFLLIRPQQRRLRAQQALQRSVEEGDEVLTTAGLYATVVEIDDDEGTVVLELAPGMHVRAVRAAIAQRITEDEYDEDEAEDTDDDEDDGESQSGFLSDATGDDATP
ncbi:MAG: preprotein translocase subunit YajC [Actinomycetota bacterium]|jgi:preprotein translocase subunit YajC|nr:preprotein translocase subunit YajC [Actinomycetota bacterium]